MPRGRLKLELITNNSARNRTFRKRKGGIMKKVNELATLCGVKACVVVNNIDNAEPEFSFSEGAEEVCSKFMEVLPEERSKKMYDHESYLDERIQKGNEKLMKLHAENREIELREVMFGLLKGKTLSPHQYSDPVFIGELTHLIDDYRNKLTYRTEFLEEANGAPPNVAAPDASGPVVGDVNPFAVGSAHGGFNDHVHYQNMNLQEPFQYQTPANFYDHNQPWFNGSSQGMNMNLQEPLQYQSPGNFYDQTQPWFNGSSLDMYTGLSHDQGQSSNQYPNQHQSLLMGQPQQMSDVQAFASVASMDDNNYYYPQLPSTSQMPLTTTTTATATPTPDLSDHGIDGKRWPTRFGLD